MMQHAPLNTAATMAAAALASLHPQVLSLAAILFACHVAWAPGVGNAPLGATGPMPLARIPGVAPPWRPQALVPRRGRRGGLGPRARQRDRVGQGVRGHRDASPPPALAPPDAPFHAIDRARGFAIPNSDLHNSFREYAHGWPPS